MTWDEMMVSLLTDAVNGAARKFDGELGRVAGFECNSEINVGCSHGDGCKCVFPEEPNALHRSDA